TRFSRDWSSDVCSSDLLGADAARHARAKTGGVRLQRPARHRHPGGNHCRRQVPPRTPARARKLHGPPVVLSKMPVTQRSTTVRNDSRLPHGAIFRGEKLEASGVAALVAALEVRDLVSRDERDAIYQLNWRFRDFARGAEIIRDRSRPTESCLVSAGYAVRAGYLRSGQRQLTSVL